MSHNDALLLLLKREVAVSVSAFWSHDETEQIARCEVHHGFAVRSQCHQQLLTVSVASPVDSASLSTTYSQRLRAWSTAVNVSSEDPLQHVLSQHLASDIWYLCGEDYYGVALAH